MEPNSITDEEGALPLPVRPSVACDLPPRAEAAWWFGELSEPVCRYLLCNGLGPADAEEVAQETFLRLYRHLARGGSRANLRAWVFEVARNAARDRRKSARWQRTVELGAAGEIADPQGGPEEDAIREEHSRQFRAAIARLSAAQRECILLRVSGLRYREIAEVLGINVASVGQLVARATAHLREDLP